MFSIEVKSFIYMIYLVLNGKDNVLVRFYLEVCVLLYKGGKINMVYSDLLLN